MTKIRTKKRRMMRKKNSVMKMWINSLLKMKKMRKEMTMKTFKMIPQVKTKIQKAKKKKIQFKSPKQFKKHLSLKLL
jgi:hypothetical protein